MKRKKKRTSSVNIREVLSKVWKNAPIIITCTILAAGLCLVALMQSGVIGEKDIENVSLLFEGQKITDDYKPDDSDDLCVSFIDVGQGDCILIESEKTVLIDCGENDCYNKVSSFLKSRGVEKIDILIATHQHTDHMGCMAKIVDDHEIGRIVMPKPPAGLVPPTRAYEALLYSVNDKGLRFTAAQTGYIYKLGSADDAPKLTVLAPLPDDDFDDLNDYSVVCRLDYRKRSFLFTGDLTEKGEKALLGRNADIKADVLKVGHHGSAHSSSREFLAKVRPGIAVISVGEQNDYGHPAEEAVKRLERYAEVITTAENGDISIYTDGRKMTVVVQKS